MWNPQKAGYLLRNILGSKVVKTNLKEDFHINYSVTSQIVAYRDCSSSYHSIAASIGRDPKTFSRIWSRWVQGNKIEDRAGSQRFPITRSREERHVTRMSLMDRTAMLRALNQELVSFARQQECLPEQFDGVCCSMDSHLGDNNRGYS
ncbi:HTH_Tnp_Tc3_2 domain-containing protein [Trichonephila clavipes]|uniref:HTH_Tnp_Tc3_2 domain-containing protein n=1 Tax=Trichonephila clavipes TaxID=2585209 RepID=A0A8X6VGD7_TRICX|nr:HTH_Tnp_Tc3_2 domain-containing protein [Trichonephila clavipes]